MANFKIEINAPKLSQNDLDAKIPHYSNPQNGVVESRNLLDAILSSAVDAEVVVTCIESGKTETYNLL